MSNRNLIYDLYQINQLVITFVVKTVLKLIQFEREFIPRYYKCLYDGRGIKTTATKSTKKY